MPSKERASQRERRRVREDKEERRGGGAGPVKGPLPFPRAIGGTARPVAGGEGLTSGRCSSGRGWPPHLHGPQAPITGPPHVFK